MPWAGVGPSTTSVKYAWGLPGGGPRSTWNQRRTRFWHGLLRGMQEMQPSPTAVTAEEHASWAIHCGVCTAPPATFGTTHPLGMLFLSSHSPPS